MIDQQDRQAVVDEEHLKLLAIGHWVSAGFWGAYGLFMVAYFGFFGFVFSTIPDSDVGAPPPEIGLLFLVMTGIALVVLIGVVTAKVMAGLWLRKRRHRIATMVVAGITCLEVPYGTMLGVLTFIALARPSVAALYATPVATPALPAEPAAPVVNRFDPND